MYEHADGGGRWGAVVFVGAQQDGSAVGTDDVREAERGGAVVLCLQAASETVLSAVAAQRTGRNGSVTV